MIKHHDKLLVNHEATHEIHVIDNRVTFECRTDFDACFYYFLVPTDDRICWAHHSENALTLDEINNLKPGDIGPSTCSMRDCRKFADDLTKALVKAITPRIHWMLDE